MPSLLFLAHRVPFPPNKGDKIRSYHLLRQLAQTHNVFLGAFVDDPADLAPAKALDEFCEETCLIPLSPTQAKLRSLKGFLSGQPLTVPYYQDRGMQRWVDTVIEARDIERVLIFSAAMAQYVLADQYRGLVRVVDFVDVDSDKWRQYADKHRWPMSWVYRREARRLLCFERRVAACCDASFFVSPAEANLFRSLAPRQVQRISHAANGVDLAFFDPALSFENPYSAHGPVLVFTGAMDYWPNSDAVAWFAKDVLPLIKQRHPNAIFTIVGGGAGPELQALTALPGVELAGRVPDVRPWIHFADIVVAPLRVARGVQNKVLEGMAMGRPTVVTPAALEGIAARVDDELLLGEDAARFSNAVCRALDDAALSQHLGKQGRALMERAYRWDSNMAAIERAFTEHMPEQAE